MAFASRVLRARAPIGNRLVRWIITFLVLTVGILILPVSSPRLSIDFDSNVSGTSQLFYNNGNSGYSEARSSINAAKAGHNLWSVSLTDTKSPLRWDPLDRDGAITVREIRIKIFGLRVPGLHLYIEPVFQISDLGFANGGQRWVIPSGDRDPQSLIRFSSFRLAVAQIGLSCVLAIILQLLAFVAFRLAGQARRLAYLMDRALAGIYLTLARECITWREFGIFFALAALGNLYFLSTYSISVDDEYAATRTSPLGWVGQGRWATYLVEKYLFPQPSLPFVPFIVLCASLAISYSLLLRAHKLSTNWKTYLGYLFFSMYPTWWCISEFYSNTPATAIGLLFTAISVYIWSLSARLSWARAAAIAVMLAIAIGTYQSTILYFLSACVGVTLLRALSPDSERDESFKPILYRAVSVLFLGAVAVVVYAIVNAAALALAKTHIAYITGFVRLDLLRSEPLGLFKGVLAEQWAIYSGSAEKFGVGMHAAMWLFLAATAGVVFARRGMKQVLVIFLWALVLMVPFGLSFVSGPDAMPLRSMLALSYVAWLMSVIALRWDGTTARTVGIAVTLLCLMQIMTVNSQYVAAATITQAQDRMLAADIYRRIGESDDAFDRSKPILIDIYGHRPVDTVYAAAWSSAIKGSFFDWDRGALGRMLIYMRIMGYPNLQGLSAEERLEATPIFETMPVWPAKGSVIKRDGKYLVRLGVDPDPVHANYHAPVR